jgi:hypothetical protein
MKKVIEMPHCQDLQGLEATMSFAKRFGAQRVIFIEFRPANGQAYEILRTAPGCT